MLGLSLKIQHEGAEKSSKDMKSRSCASCRLSHANSLREPPSSAIPRSGKMCWHLAAWATALTGHGITPALLRTCENNSAERTQAQARISVK